MYPRLRPAWPERGEDELEEGFHGGEAALGLEAGAQARGGAADFVGDQGHGPIAGEAFFPQALDFAHQDFLAG